MFAGEQRAIDDGLNFYARVRAYIPGILCFFLSHLSQGCATKVSTLFNNVPLFPENKGLFRGNIGHFRENMGLFWRNMGILGGSEPNLFWGS